MSWLLTVANVLVNVLLIAFAASVSFAIFRLISKGSHPTTGDPALAQALERRASRWSTRRVAVAYVDLNRRPSTRMAFMGCDELTPFELGWATQGLTGLLAADAVARSEVRLDEPLHDLDDRLRGTALGEQTLKSLLTHTSGLPRLPWQWRVRRVLQGGLYGGNPFPSSGPDLVTVAARQKLTPGYRTSPLGAALAGQLIAERAGQGFHSLLDERVLQPLGMVDSSTAPGQHQVKRGWNLVGRRAFGWRMDGYAPGGGAVTTLADAAVLVQSLLRKQAVGQRAVQAVNGVTTGPGASRQGMLWLIDTLSAEETGLSTKRQMVWQVGQTGGYSAFIGVFPEAKQGIVVLSDTAADAITRGMGLSILQLVTP